MRLFCLSSSLSYISICVILIYSTPSHASSELTEEDKYIKYYHNDPYVQRCWNHLRDVYFAKDKEHLKLICGEFHKLAGKGSVVVDTVKMTINVIRFKNPAYFPARVDVVTYGINGTDEGTGGNLTSYFYLTEGLKSDCAYYLSPAESQTRWPEFHLDQHVCGMSMSMFEW